MPISSELENIQKIRLHASVIRGMYHFKNVGMILTKREFLMLLNLVIGSSIYSQNSDKLKLWYTQPASIWEEALPLGNGKMGAMVFGGIQNEQFQMNDLTLWSGAPNDGNRQNGPETLKATRAAVFAGDYAKADTIWRGMHGPYSARYLPMANLMIQMNLPDTTITDYYRDLDISSAISTVTTIAKVLVLNAKRSSVSLINQCW